MPAEDNGLLEENTVHPSDHGNNIQLRSPVEATMLAKQRSNEAGMNRGMLSRGNRSVLNENRNGRPMNRGNDIQLRIIPSRRRFEEPQRASGTWNRSSATTSPSSTERRLTWGLSLINSLKINAGRSGGSRSSERKADWRFSGILFRRQPEGYAGLTTLSTPFRVIVACACPAPHPQTARGLVGAPDNLAAWIVIALHRVTSANSVEPSCPRVEELPEPMARDFVSE